MWLLRPTKGEIDRNVRAAYLRHGYVPEPHCIFRGMAKLPPAHWIEVTNGVAGAPISYWSLAQASIVQRRAAPIRFQPC